MVGRTDNEKNDNISSCLERNHECDGSITIDEPCFAMCCRVKTKLIDTITA